MATVEKTFREVKKMIEVDVHEDVYTLTLSKGEAEFLLEVTFRHVTGSSVDSPRKHGDAIHRALADAGVNPHAIVGLGRGHIRFDNYPKPEKPAAESPLKVGDSVRVTSAGYLGETGDLRQIDTADPDLPYLVYINDYSDTRWVKSVERVSE